MNNTDPPVDSLCPNGRSLSAAIVPSTAPWPVTATLVSAVPLEALLE
eukprot:COSAG06_NODE_26876_length_605_cov_7.106719_1_plen_46_part_10